MIIKVRFFLLLIISIILSFTNLHAATKTNNKIRAQDQTRIRSDIIDIKRKSQSVTFLNNVVVEKQDSSLLAQKMIVLYNETGAKKGQIKKIEAFDNVKIFSEDFIASGEYGYYDPVGLFFVLERKVIVNNGTSIGSGDKFIYNIKTKKGNFVGKRDETSLIKAKSDKRVTVIIGNDINEQKRYYNNKKKND